MAETWGKKLEEAIPILTLGAGLLALFLGVDNWWVIFVIGWVVLTPLASVLFGDGEEEKAVEETRTGDSAAEPDRTTEDALETLRDRYARGELTEEQFERKVERLLETETLEDARDHVARRTERRDAAGEPESGRRTGEDEDGTVEPEVEPEFERERED